jgi:hypothetical protein
VKHNHGSDKIRTLTEEETLVITNNSDSDIDFIPDSSPPEWS